MLIRSYEDIHTPNINTTLLFNCLNIGRKNYWIGKSDPPHNFVEEYIQQWYHMFLTGDYMGIEYWVYKSEDGNSFDPFHFDKDEMDPQIEHPKWTGLVNLTLDQGATCISDMTYGDLKPTKCFYSYGQESKTVIWDGDRAWSDLAGHDDCKLYLNVWTKRIPKGLTRSEEMPYYRQSMLTGIYKKNRIKTYEGEFLHHTHVCGDLFDHFVIKEPAERNFGDTYLVPDVVVS
tara:strand:+ start:203 stop:895 length:693 start_codon:yes stop_codon:yes gene_type:complete